MAKHRTDVISLLFGALFLAAAGTWGLTGDVGWPGQSWYLPALLIVVGLIGLVGARRAGPDT